MDNQTGPFTILEPDDQEISELYVVQDRHTSDFEALKLGKGRSRADKEYQHALTRTEKKTTNS